ncbi:MAG: transposase [Methylocystis sp.]
MYQEILGSQQRRQWTDAKKLKIIEEIGVNGATVEEVARRHELARQHLYQWRNYFCRKRALLEEDDIAFLPVEMKPNRRPASLKADGVFLEIGLSNGRSLRSVTGLPEDELLRLIRLVERA